MYLFAPPTIDFGDLGNRRHLPEETHQIVSPVFNIFVGPRQLRGPTNLSLNFPDKLADFGRCRFALSSLNANEQSPLLLI